MAPLRTLAFLALIAGISSSQTSDCSYMNLLRHLNLMKENDVVAAMRPVRNWTTPTLVQMDMLLYGILEVNEKFQTVTSHIWIQMRWTNEFLTWNPSDFCGIDSLTVPRSWLWIPDVNIVEDASDTGSILNSPTISLSSSGSMLASARQRLTSTCQLNLKLFPFDKQNCTISFLSMNFDVKAIVLGTASSETTLTQISEQIMVTQGEWQLEHIDITTVKMRKGEDQLVYTVTISRKPMLYLINFILPLFFFLVLDLASFFINESTGEKLSFKVTVLLSISVLLLILKDMLPSTEDKLPMIATYCATVFALVGLSVLEAMLVSFLNDFDGNCGKNLQRSVDTQVDIQMEVNCHTEPAGAEENPEKCNLPLDQPNGLDVLRLILQEVKAARQEAEGQDKDKRKPGRYAKVAEIINSVFFTFYFLTVMVFLLYMTLVWCLQVC
ncbi:5-hydroxytryptamine receptor 3C-like [Plectropomus leopardus]|uniref:5-hydroxytryptamine receptor 3C-like n=1 Tax=Plectropomus leopardus TaxID=160734 RepID=UPI001C4BCEC2|nr:5-hydroxytryptamine receptor 3C-like [Plectropomus leopardus]